MYFEVELNIKWHFKRGIGPAVDMAPQSEGRCERQTGLPGAAGDAGGPLQSPPSMAWYSWVGPPWARPPRSLLHFDWLVRCSSPPSQILAS